MTTKSPTRNMVKFAAKSTVHTALGPHTVATKTHDGLNKSNDLFNNMIKQFFTPPVTIITRADQLPPGPVQLFRMRTGDLIRRLDMRKRATPVLVGGGGGSCKVSNEHAPYLKSLLTWLAKAAPIEGSRQWMLEQPTSAPLFTQEGVTFVKEVVDGLIK